MFDITEPLVAGKTVTNALNFRVGCIFLIYVTLGNDVI
jgi:hypothetical protein